MKVVEARSPPMMDAEKMLCEEFLSFVPRTLTIILKGEVSPKPDLLSLLVKTSFLRMRRIQCKQKVLLNPNKPSSM